MRTLLKWIKFILSPQKLVIPEQVIKEVNYGSFSTLKSSLYKNPAFYPVQIYKLLNIKIKEYHPQFIKEDMDIILEVLEYIKTVTPQKPTIIELQYLFNEYPNEHQMTIYRWYEQNFDIKPLALLHPQIFLKDTKVIPKSMSQYLLYQKSMDPKWQPKNDFIFYEPLVKDLLYLSIEEVLEKYSSQYGPKIKKLSIDNFRNGINLYRLKLLESLNFKSDYIQEILNEQDKLFTGQYKSLLSLPYKANILLDYYSEKRLVKLFKDLFQNPNQVMFYQDSLLMLTQLIEFNSVNPDTAIDIDLPKIKQFQELHDYLILLSKKIKQSNFTLTGQERLLPFEIIKDDHFKFKIPLKNYDLIEIGEKLHICVGTGYYAEQICNNKLSIITIFKNNRLSYCVSLSPITNAIFEAKGAYNQFIPPEDLNWIKTKINTLRK